jgi:hypothetical protein
MFVEDGAIILGSTDTKSWVNNLDFISANNLNNIAIYGSGVINAQGTSTLQELYQDFLTHTSSIDQEVGAATHVLLPAFQAKFGGPTRTVGVHAWCCSTISRTPSFMIQRSLTVLTTTWSFTSITVRCST